MKNVKERKECRVLLKRAETNAKNAAFFYKEQKKTDAQPCRKVLADFAICDWWRYCKALCDVNFSQIEENGRTFFHIELSNRIISYTF